MVIFSVTVRMPSWATTMVEPKFQDAFVGESVGKGREEGETAEDKRCQAAGNTEARHGQPLQKLTLGTALSAASSISKYSRFFEFEL